MQSKHRVPLFSVVTVTLNCQRDALETARSVWAQERADYEYIVKDGCSTDGTVESIRKEGKPVKIVIKPDRGIYDAMNQAIELCSGRYVLFLNGGDNFRIPNALDLVSKTIRETNEPEVVYTYNYNVLRKTIVQYPANLGRFYLFRRSVNHQATYIRRDCYVKHGLFDTNFQMLADNELLAKLLLKHGCRSALCPVAAVDYRDGGISTSPKNRLRIHLERDLIRKQYFTKWEQLRFTFWHALMLPGIREQCLYRYPSAPITRTYYKLANSFNRLLGRH